MENASNQMSLRLLDMESFEKLSEKERGLLLCEVVVVKGSSTNSSPPK